MADRTARTVHAQRLEEKAGSAAIRPDPALMSSLGLGAANFATLMQALGFRGDDARGFAFAPARAPRGPARNRQPAASGAALPFAHLNTLLSGRGDGRE
jgi:hypothetical protein